MRLRHFEELRPVCPRCRSLGAGSWPLAMADIVERAGDTVVQGALHCSNGECRLEFPVVDGVPVLVADVRSLLRDQISAITVREDLAAPTWSMLGDAAGPGSELDTRRQHLSIYGWDGYGEFDPQEPRDPQPGAVARCLRVGLEQTGPVTGPILDLGCGTGRSTFELARETDAPVLGVDLGYTLLKLAHGVLRDGVARYPLRRVGLVYDHRTVATPFGGADNVDFWLCDALNPPFRDGTFGAAVALNLLDCVADPVALLNVMGRCLATAGKAVVATPYDWSTAATPVEAWLGGHSQRGPLLGRPEAFVRSLFGSRGEDGGAPGAVRGAGGDRGREAAPAGGRERTLVIRSEVEHVPWHTRLHDRSVMHYDVHLLALEVVAGAGPVGG